MCLEPHRVDLEGVEQVEGNGGEQVEDEPALEVVERDEARLVRHLPAFTHVRRAEIEDDVCRKGLQC